MVIIFFCLMGLAWPFAIADLIFQANPELARMNVFMGQR
jgi:hypothetical protein